MRVPPWRLASLVGLLLSLPGCELQEVTLTRPEDIVVAEGQVIVSLVLPPGGREADRVPHLTASVFLHRTFGADREVVPNATVVITDRDAGTSVTLPEVDPDRCLLLGPEDGAPPPVGGCYRLSVAPSPFPPGSRLDLEVTTPGGGLLTGTTTVPGGYAFLDLAYEAVSGTTQDFRFCSLPPDSRYRISWTAATGAWVYLGETNINGLDRILGPMGVEVPPSIFLDGLAVGGDTDIVFPSEFGVFDRFDLDRELSLLLQEGLPAGTDAAVAVSALDRNWINWARGGGFNPSGAVRIPSVFGDGTGVFGAAVRQGFTVIVAPTDAEAPNLPPRCGPVE